MNTKKFRGKLEFKANDAGEFRAVFSTFNVIDADNDVTLPGAFTENQPLRISYWGHRWHDLPVGRGILHQNEKEAWIDGKFFLDTEGGRETYRTVKNLGELQEWSYGYDVEEARRGQFEDQEVTFLQRLTVHEVSPVMLGAGVNTRTETIKAYGTKPYPNEHACRLRDPADFQEDSFRRVSRKHDGKEYHVIMGRLEGEDTMTEQAYRYSIDVWEADEARAHCADHNGRFAAATGKQDIGTLKFQGSPRNPYGTHASRGYPGGRAGWRNAWRIYLSQIAQGPIQGTIRRIGMIAATMKCDLPEMSADDVTPRSGACGELSGKIYENPGDYGLDDWKKPSDDDLEPEDVQLTCQDLADLKRACLAEIAKRHACEEKTKAGGAVDTEGEAGDGKPSGTKPSVFLSEIEILDLEV
jgi:HK97 family phage prohead protease